MQRNHAFRQMSRKSATFFSKAPFSAPEEAPEEGALEKKVADLLAENDKLKKQSHEQQNELTHWRRFAQVDD